MKNREITFYSLLDTFQLRHIEEMADEMSVESFISLGFAEKWEHHLWIEANNKAFIERIKNVHVYDLRKLDRFLGEQLKLYTRKCGEGHEESNGDFYSTYQARSEWINHTVYLCKRELMFYNKDQIFNEVIEWCAEWTKKWLIPYVSPSEDKLNPITYKEPSQTRDLIFDIINGIDRDNGWGYAFRSKEDLDIFIELLTCFFEQREYVITSDIIRLKKGSKTRMALRIKEIHLELSDRPLKGDNAFFDIVRTLHLFSEDSNLYNTIGR